MREFNNIYHPKCLLISQYNCIMQRNNSLRPQKNEGKLLPSANSAL